MLATVEIIARRLVLQTPGVRATVPMLRGVWGAALHGLNRQAYQQVFEGVGLPHERMPAYVLRPGPPTSDGHPTLDWILIGPGLPYDQVLLRAWDVASGMGLGPDRRRFFLLDILTLTPTGEAATAAPGDSVAWDLSKAVWPRPSESDSGSYRLLFPAPLRLISNHQLVEKPSLSDLIVAAIRRLAAFLGYSWNQKLSAMAPGLQEAARRLPARPWRGQRLDLVRYSARQRTELELRGVSGHLDLPEGAGELWPWLAAMQWLHLGKGTTLGLGQLVIMPLPKDETL
ncbi:MAG: CRISPR system precrRNA processing endoribonuclease RAMP protein Cas6 [Thermodesulfobacteriota bacterium]